MIAWVTLSRRRWFPLHVTIAALPRPHIGHSNHAPADAGMSGPSGSRLEPVVGSGDCPGEAGGSDGDGRTPPRLTPSGTVTVRAAGGDVDAQPSCATAARRCVPGGTFSV